MRKTTSSGIFLIMLLPFLLVGADKSKKAYELIYKDVQLLKQQILQLEEKIENNTGNIKDIKQHLEELLDLVKRFQAEQASFKEDQKKIPTQYLVILEKMESISSQLMKFSDELLEIKRASLAPPEQQEAEEEQTPPANEGKEKEAEEPMPNTPIPPPTLSPQEVYNMAYSDYLKGNFQLAIEGFTLYRINFPQSPLSDNALYWIGECYFSQEEYQKAIDQFNALILNYPQGDRTPAAYLKKGISLVELGKKEEALVVFKLLISKYPLEEETKIAQQKIKELLVENEGY